MNVKCVSSSSVLSWMYCDMSESSSSSAATYAGLPLPPGTSLSWIPPSSLYCCHRSVSRISAVARNLRIAASPFGRLPLCSSGLGWPRTVEVLTNSPAPTVAAPTAVNPFFTNERRLVELFKPFSRSFIGGISFLGLDIENRAAGVNHRGPLRRYDFDGWALQLTAQRDCARCDAHVSHTCQGFVICLSCKKGQTSVLSLFRKRLAFGMCGGQYKLPFTASAGGAEVRAAQGAYARSSTERQQSDHLRCEPTGLQ